MPRPPGRRESPPAPPARSLSYTYDRLGNPLSRSDANTSLSETFIYDALNRLTTTTVNLSPTPLSKAFTYDAVGNI